MREFFNWLMDTRRRGAMLIAPAVALLFVMNIFPLMWSFGLSFFHYKASSMKPPTFAGLYYYKKVLADPVVWERFQTTAVIVSASVLMQMIIGFCLALLFVKKFPLRREILMLILTPMMLSFVAVGVFFKLFYEPTFGLVSQLFIYFTGEPLILLGTKWGAILGIVIADAWMWSPFVMLLVLAGLVSVPDCLYEAAEVDSASAWDRFKTVTFPT